MMEGLRRALAVPKSEIDRREKEWQERAGYKGKPKNGDGPIAN